MDEPGAPPPADQCVFIKRGDPDDRVFVPGERVCVKNHEGERTIGKIVEHTPHDFVKVILDTEFASRLAKGQDRKGIPLSQPKIHVGKLLATESDDPTTAGRRSRSKRSRKNTRRHRRRRHTRR